VQRTINQRFKEVRESLKKNKKMTAAEVADLFDMTYNNYNKIERGNSSPSVGYIISAYKKEELGNLNWMWFIFGEGEMWLDAPVKEVSEPPADYGQIKILMKQLEILQRENERLELSNEKLRSLIDKSNQ